MSWVIAMRATKARAPKSTGFVDDLGVGNRLTRGGGVSLRPDLSRHQQGRLRWRDPPLHRMGQGDERRLGTGCWLLSRTHCRPRAATDARSVEVMPKPEARKEH